MLELGVRLSQGSSPLEHSLPGLQFCIKTHAAPLQHHLALYTLCNPSILWGQHTNPFRVQWAFRLLF